MRKITSPNTVIAKYIEDTIDILRPKIELKKPKEIVFYIGTNINGVPHLATALVHCIGFLFAQKIQNKFNVPCSVKVGIHDNISYESKCAEDGVVYHKSYFHSLGQEKVVGLVNEYYSEYLTELSSSTGVKFSIEHYSEAQKKPSFRKAFLQTLSHRESTSWCVAPSSGKLQVRIPCPTCKFSDRDSKHTQYEINSDNLKIIAVCPDHGEYVAEIKKDNETYLDLTTLYRNLVKELEMIGDSEKMHVIVKGGDWIYSTQTIDLAFACMGYGALEIPSRIFTPQLVTMTGAKLSKTLIEAGDLTVSQIPEWLLDLAKFKSNFGPNYMQKIMKLAEELFRDPRNMYRTYTIKEIVDILS